jgi:hypothetical protein
MTAQLKLKGKQLTPEKEALTCKEVNLNFPQPPLDARLIRAAKKQNAQAC